MFFFRLLSMLPLWILYLVSDLFYLIARFGIRYRMEVIEENLRFAFPEKSEKERKRIRNKFYRNLTDSFAETIKLLTISEKELKKRFLLTNQNLPDEAVQSGTSAIMTAGHFFNWEMAIVLIALVSKVEVETIYLKINHPFFNQLMLKIRTHFGGVLTEKRDFRKNMITMRSKPRIVQLASDQRPGSSENRYQREFMNRPAVFFEGAEFLAKKMSLPVFFGTVKKVKRGHYSLEIANLASPPYNFAEPHSITDAYCQKLEENIWMQPDLYLWSHKRWKIS
jgi:Kdo2-lipid IVA lauroyltransferase/acyltransferase